MRTLTGVLILGAIAVTAATGNPVLAQDAAGRWKGRMEPTNHSAEIELELRRAGTAWQADLQFRAGPDTGALPIEDLRVDDDGVLVRTMIEGADVSLDFTFADNMLLGSVRVTENGRVLVEGPAGLARASDAEAQSRLTSWLDAQGASVGDARRSSAVETALELFAAN
jgi:hypothetical protein